MKSLFSRWLPCLTLATWSVILLGFCITGRVRDFLTPEFRLAVLIAGIAMGLMAAVFALFPADATCCSTANCGHSLSRFKSGKIITFLILLLPITAAAMFSADNFSATTITNRGVITDAGLLGGSRRTSPAPPPELPLPSEDAAPLQNSDATPSAGAPTAATAQQPAADAPADYLQRTADGKIIVEVLDLLYAAQDNSLRKDFEGKGVQLIGQLMPDTDHNGNGKRFKAVRMFMTCCAADARPVATLVESPQKLALPEMAWVKVTGTATFPLENGRRLAVLKADTVETTPPPADSMLY